MEIAMSDAMFSGGMSAASAVNTQPSHISSPTSGLPTFKSSFFAR